MASLRREVAFDEARPNEKNPAGLHIVFSKIGENDWEQRHVAVYRAYVVGAAQKQKYVLAIWKIGSAPQLMPGDVYVNAKGLLMAHKPRPDQENRDSVDEDDEVDFAIQAARGEPARFILATPDGKLAVPGTVVPYPIQSQDRSCRLEARLALPEAIAVMLYADGLAPNSDVAFHALSEGESHDGVFHADAHGHGAAITLPNVKGKDAGILKVSVSTNECSTSVEVPWGKGSYKPL
ncbi:MAG TPA: hypothetical protein VMU48_16700 [Terracidiphilus sp.]|nr:hypothetical protein [Terracidiphilus sp.]